MLIESFIFLKVSCYDIFFQVNDEQVLLRVCDEVCDVISSVSTATLMNLGADIYSRLQSLLAAR